MNDELKEQASKIKQEQERVGWNNKSLSGTEKYKWNHRDTRKRKKKTRGKTFWYW